LTENEIRDLIAEKHAHAQAQDFFAILGVGPAADRSQIQKAYFDLARIIHPDRIRKSDFEDLITDATVVFKVLSDAYNTLTNPEQRAEYISQSGILTSHSAIREGDEASEEQDLMEAAKIFNHKGSILMKRSQFSDAEDFFRQAHEAQPENSIYAMRLGWAVFRNTERKEGDRNVEAKRFLKEAVKLDESNPEAQYYMGLYYKASGNVEMCRKHLKLAVANKRHYVEAEREIRLLAMRSGTEPKWTKKSRAKAREKAHAKARDADDTSENDEQPVDKGGFFSRLFGKKS
jgi:curved DNA-binding protein CbpA